MRPESPELPNSSAPARGRVVVSPVGSRRIEVTLGVAMSVFGALFSFQSVPALLAQWSAMRSALGLALIVLVFGTIAVAGLAAMLRQWTRQIFLTAAAAYLIALALWPAAVVHPLPGGDIPWLLQIATVPAGFVIVGRRDRIVPAVYIVLLGIVFLLLRVSPVGGEADLGRAVLDALYSVALNVALFVLTVGVRLAATSVDTAQNAALQRYASAQIDHAMEAERVATDALVHDSVLTTFLAAAAARTPEAQALAARMARKSMGHLTRATVAAETGPRVSLGELLSRIRKEGDAVADRFAFRAEGEERGEIPADVADAIALAIVQAMMNSVKHAGGPEVPRSVVVRGAADGSVLAEVTDGGRGFDPATMKSERLGVRVSILERIRLVEGEAEVQSAPGVGTTVRLRWPATAPAPAAEAEEAMATG